MLNTWDEHEAWELPLRGGLGFLMIVNLTEADQERISARSRRRQTGYIA
jgi:hypothetical protein